MGAGQNDQLLITEGCLRGVQFDIQSLLLTDFVLPASFFSVFLMWLHFPRSILSVFPYRWLFLLQAGSTNVEKTEMCIEINIKFSAGQIYSVVHYYYTVLCRLSPDFLLNQMAFCTSATPRQSTLTSVTQRWVCQQLMSVFNLKETTYFYNQLNSCYISQVLYTLTLYCYSLLQLMSTKVIMSCEFITYY